MLEHQEDEYLVLLTRSKASMTHVRRVHATSDLHFALESLDELFRFLGHRRRQNFERHQATIRTPRAAKDRPSLTAADALIEHILTKQRTAIGHRRRGAAAAGLGGTGAAGSGVVGFLRGRVQAGTTEPRRFD